MIKDVHVYNATDAVMNIIIYMMLIFTIPAEPKFWCLRPRECSFINYIQIENLILYNCMRSLLETGSEKPRRALLDWKYIQDRLPRGIVLLLGHFEFD